MSKHQTHLRLQSKLQQRFFSSHSLANRQSFPCGLDPLAGVRFIRISFETDALETPILLAISVNESRWYIPLSIKIRWDKLILLILTCFPQAVTETILPRRPSTLTERWEKCWKVFEGNGNSEISKRFRLQNDECSIFLTNPSRSSRLWAVTDLKGSENLEISEYIPCTFVKVNLN